MASPAEAAEMVASAAAAAASEAKGKEEKERREGPGVLGRIWRALFGGRGEDYEKRLQNLSKEEAAVLARMGRRAHFSRRGVRNLIALSVLGEVGAVVYAIIVTKSEDLDWQMRAIRVLPMFLLPALSSMMYSVLVSFTRMLERKDKDTLERLRAERKAKIDELKDRTNYYLTQELIQKYDLDPAAKAAAASVLASKMGAETGFEVHMADEVKSGSAQARSSEVEVIPPNGLQNRKETKAKGSSYRSTTAAHAQQDTSNEAGGGGMESMPPSKVVEHYQGLGTSDGGWIAKIAALLVGEDPSQSYALICGHCHMHNGLARKEDFSHVTYYCPHCHALNMSNQSIGQRSSSDSVQELSEEADAWKQVEPAN
ncbi:uncharacterized protein At2g24330-like isoform X2 [Panicum hallii]|uniref:uncharacterized protein At2g24330-like isoform X2 n=1 Tax=Panicum hallii TaxID=206008 RepID=UPI000DF4DD7D|nr:uncharacterized protein At2g24330-like isoform X2 [Panicum hallii]XP_025826460.1 uncharacterized protein At2g24330-like isoform X2 [Panicum hallii]XP_025826461.1 uncharacterized protein At2g24330-like isoform X2 [Panicum hallii]